MIVKKFKSLVWMAGVGLFLCAGIGYLTYHQVARHTTEKLTLNVNQLGQKLDAQLMRYSKLPEVLARDPRLLRPLLQDMAIEPPSAPSAQQYQATSELLEQWGTILGADTIYLLNQSGTTLAASNWQQADSFVGHNYGYRPYFRDAIEGGKGQFFALGVRSNKRGYYFSSPVSHGKQIIGVLTIKVDLSLIEDIWQYEDLEYVIADPFGVIFYSSEPSWLYRALVPLTAQQKSQIFASRQYGNAPLAPLTAHRELAAFQQNSISQMTLPAQDHRASFVVASRDMAQAGMTIYGFSPITVAYRYVFQAIMMFALVYTLLCLAVISWWQTRKAQRALAQLNDRLEQLVIKRTNNLLESNQRLRETVKQYEHSQAELKQTQSELVQAAKLATLGELSASINHEINQPLAAMRTYTENSRKLLAKERYDAVASNLDEILHLNQSVAEIIARFKVFARKARGSDNRTVAADAIRAATTLLHNQLIKAGIILRVGELSPDIQVNADAVQFEQVLVNLLHNAIQALADAHQPQIGIRLQADDEYVEVRIWDNGPGMDEAQKQQIFTPFFTTKHDGLGLGLTISRRIIDSFSGTLTVTDHPEGGAEFVITLPRSTKDTA
ncbi:ATP-binding protein [Photobacterium sp. MCCC 1A19761]|uniref:sensor histidine kinase n=1 Tax=Photobacterium sp. MCCC 1A19761 TaxID=3115000 RepID=UPI00307D0D71